MTESTPDTIMVTTTTPAARARLLAFVEREAALDALEGMSVLATETVLDGIEREKQAAAIAAHYQGSQPALYGQPVTALQKAVTYWLLMGVPAARVHAALADVRASGVLLSGAQSAWVRAIEVALTRRFPDVYSMHESACQGRPNRPDCRC